MIHSSVGDTRSEADDLMLMQQTVATDPAAVKWHLLRECLNTHQAASLVRYVAQVEGTTLELGIKGKSGIRHSMASRAAFFTDPTLRIVFHFTSKHCSWLNQVELWFGTLMRKRLKRGNFLSQADLKTRILDTLLLISIAQWQSLSSGLIEPI